jgi:hypothetical protein
MAIHLGKYSFSGPLGSTDKVKERSGVFAVVCKSDMEFFLMDVGEGSKLRTTIEKQDEKDCWRNSCSGQILIFVHYTSFSTKQERNFIVQELKDLFDPACRLEPATFFRGG